MMDERIVEFVRGLRAAGVTISTAEGIDALHAVTLLGVGQRECFKATLRTTLIKEHRTFELFDELFDLYFGQAEPSLQNAFEPLSAGEVELLRQALAALDERTAQLLDWLTSGAPPTAEMLEQLAQQAGIRWVERPQHGRWISRRVLQQMGFGSLAQRLSELEQRLHALGLAEATIEHIMGIISGNREQLQRYVAEQVSLKIARRRAERPHELHSIDLLHKPFNALDERDMHTLRMEIQRLLQQMKTRAALRRKRQKTGQFDARRTIRYNQRYAGVPLELKYKKRKRKPSLVLIFDVSSSMRRMIEFMLHFVAELQDQVNKTRSFAFYDNLAEVSALVNRYDMHTDGGAAFQAIQQAIPGHLWRTNLGHSLHTFFDNYLSAVDGRTTVIIVGDGRNNYYDPRLDLVKELHRRAKQLIWLNPENERIWGTGDSDMREYAPLCDDVHSVRNLAQLSNAIDKILTT